MNLLIRNAVAILTGLRGNEARANGSDLRVRYVIDRQWTASFGIDNLNNDQYWNFHPYPQRNYTFELKWKC